jgi:glutaminyl-tRNA synthetase
VELIKKGLAYVCELTPEQFKEYRGDTSHPAVSPYRDRPVEENLDLFARMKNGEFAEGKYTLRAKIDLASGNFNMRDPVLYRIRYIDHHRQGTKWCIFPMYDFAHPIQDALEGITHSLCSLEYEEHRPLYDWVVSNVSDSLPQAPPDRVCPPGHRLHRHVQAQAAPAGGGTGRVSGWDDPRMPTLCGLRRRGYTPRPSANFCERIGVSKVDVHRGVRASWSTACGTISTRPRKRTMAVLHPVKLT